MDCPHAPGNPTTAGSSPGVCRERVHDVGPSHAWAIPRSVRNDGLETPPLNCRNEEVRLDGSDSSDCSGYSEESGGRAVTREILEKRDEKWAECVGKLGKD